MMTSGIITVNRVLSDEKSIDFPPNNVLGPQLTPHTPQDVLGTHRVPVLHHTPRKHPKVHITASQKLITKRETHHSTSTHAHDLGRDKSRPALLKGYNHHREPPDTTKRRQPVINPI
jgi:hypothetical protein